MKKDSADDLKGQLEAYAAIARMPERNTRGRWAKWPIYAAATGAALAGASAASADIIYSGPLTLSASPANGLSVSPDGKHRFSFSVGPRGGRHFNSSTTSFRGYPVHHSSFNLFNERGVVGGSQTVPGLGVGVFASGLSFVKNFALGAKIAPGSHTNLFGGGNLGSLNSVMTHQGNLLGTNGVRGPFLTPGFLGFEMFQTTGNGGVKPGSAEFGWIEVQFNSAYPPSDEVLGYAYNTDGPITAGETGSVVPEPSFLPLMLLAGGAAGVLAWKKHRSRQAPNA